VDVWEQFSIQKYNHEHKVVQGQVPGEINPLLTLHSARNYVTPLPALVEETTKTLHLTNATSHQTRCSLLRYELPTAVTQLIDNDFVTIVLYFHFYFHI